MSPATGAAQTTTTVAGAGTALVVFAWWAVDDGGMAPTTWYSGALLVLIAFVLLAGARRLGSLSRWTRWALAGLAGYTVWSFLSLLWAQSRGDAWDGANRTLLYLLVFALFAALPWTSRRAGVALGAFVLVVAVIGAGALAGAVAGDVTAAFADGRLAAPTGYENASAALYLMALWPAITLAARREAPPAVRAAMLAAAGVLVDLGILAQSRGSLIGGGVALVVALWAAPNRGRLIVALGAVAVATAAALPFLLRVYASSSLQREAAVTRAGAAILVAAIALFAAGSFSRRLDGRPMPRLPVRVPGVWRWAAVAALLAVVAAGAATARATILDGAREAQLTTRLTPSGDPGRYDLWRVAAGQFAAHPLQGAGADNFAHAYAQDRRHHEELMYPHSVEWRVLGQTGLVGAALLGGFLAAGFAGAHAAIRRTGGGTVALGAALAAIYWIAHASLDWLWEMPAAGAPAMAALGMAAGMGTVAAPNAAVLVAPRGGRRTAALAVVAIVAAASLALPALAAFEIEHAARIGAADPAAARRALDRARALNPLSDRPDVVAGALAVQAGDAPAARSAYARAIGRDPGSWHSQAQLGVLELEAGRRSRAVSLLARAQELNPLEPSLPAALAAARSGGPAPAEVTDRLARSAIPGPLGPRPVTCRPVLGLDAACSRGTRR
ncbi:O-antigen ligase family protein [Capillimicrobium parvum]|uniref:O-antigen ligase-related domain-containing protein n=1 Tax=Capillimicrobium parvum TaxID=2884022 RepID=A0A9E6XV24_9ACTN|nr:O-antigen ligase family protein [Capillimicrobium parvum]UGS35000.1 hypothetical protein DSM104329_01384 [Capillimicrobium parvum]